MDKVPGPMPELYHQLHYYWTLLQAEGQGMVVAFMISALRVIYDGKQQNLRRDISEVLLAPLLAYGIFKSLQIVYVDPATAVPIGMATAIVGVKWIRDRLTNWLDKKLPKGD